MPERIKNYALYVTYLRSIASGIKALNPGKGKPAFYEFEEFFKGSSLVYPAMVAIPPEISLSDENSNNTFKEFAAEIWIMTSVKKDDAADKSTKLQLCEQITEQIIAKIIKDFEDYSLGVNRPINSLDKNKIKYTQLGPQQNDNLHGFAIEFPFGNPFHFIIDSNLWW